MAQDLSLLSAVKATAIVAVHFHRFEHTLSITHADFGLAPRSCAVCNAGGSKS
jgi:hypothetical protein